MICVSKVAASPATFVTALPVAKDQLLIRFNAQPLFGTSGYIGVQFPVNIAYGFTSRWALFLNANQGFGSLTEPSPLGPASLNSSGVGDTLFFARYTLFKIDKPKSTFRIAPLAGAFFPTGNNALRSEQGLLPQALQTGSGTVDPYFGVTMGYNNSRWGMAADTTYRRNATSDQGISPGSELRSDAQFELRVIPLHLPEEGNPKVLWLSIESNYVQDLRSDVNGIPAASSGGKSLNQDVTLEWTTLHWQLGVGAQVPVMQDLPGVGRIREHSGAFVFFEYYLAAPQRRHGRRRS
jgi:hypothetical protein